MHRASEPVTHTADCVDRAPALVALDAARTEPRVAPCTGVSLSPLPTTEPVGCVADMPESHSSGTAVYGLDVPPERAPECAAPPTASELNHSRVDLLEHLIRENGEISLDSLTRHHFAPGVYARELTIPAGVVLTGKIHKTAHLNVVSAGRITVWSEEHGMRTITAPYTFMSSPGVRRVGFAHEDTVWTTIHPTDETDLAKLEQILIEPHDSSLIPLDEIRHKLTTAIQELE